MNDNRLAGARAFHDLACLFTCDNRNRGILRMNMDESMLVWKAVEATKGRILEIGRRHGGSTVLLCAASGTREVVSVDLAPEHHPVCDAFFRGVGERLKILIGDSGKMADGGEYGLLFVDGDHSLRGVLRDVVVHWGALSGGEAGDSPLAAFHDACENDGLAHMEAGRRNCYGGVNLVVGQLVACGAAAEWARAGSLCVLKKVGELPIGFAEGVMEEAERCGVGNIDREW